MRIIKILLIVLFAALCGLHGYTSYMQTFDGYDVPPVLVSDRETLEISVKDDKSILLTGISASDDQDGDLTADIQIAGISKLINDNTAKVTYLVFDSDQNMATLVRPVRFVDYTAPRFHIREPLVYYRSESIQLLDRLSVTDVIDGDITDSIRISQLSPTSAGETYLVMCQATNSMGDTIFLELPVIQYDGIALRPEIRLTDYLVYLQTGAAFDARSYLKNVTTPDGTGDLSSVAVEGAVDTTVPGVYMVRYSYTHNDNTGVSILTVVVE